MTLNCHSPWPEVNAVFLYLRDGSPLASIRSLNQSREPFMTGKGIQGVIYPWKRVAVLLGDVVKFFDSPRKILWSHLSYEPRRLEMLTDSKTVL
ncbi:hypothetical protein TNCV_2215971 [Trichonephila clavipes]|nr:hypothetical protein TNCV_2215971 [Trichonephila clavipes]